MWLSLLPEILNPSFLNLKPQKDMKKLSVSCWTKPTLVLASLKSATGIRRAECVGVFSNILPVETRLKLKI